MCEKCDELDHKIRNYRQLAQAISDERILDSIAKSIIDLEAQKATLHPNPVPSPPAGEQPAAQQQQQPQPEKDDDK